MDKRYKDVVMEGKNGKVVGFIGWIICFCFVCICGKRIFEGFLIYFIIYDVLL